MVPGGRIWWRRVVESPQRYCGCVAEKITAMGPVRSVVSSSTLDDRVRASIEFGSVLHSADSCHRRILRLEGIESPG